MGSPRIESVACDSCGKLTSEWVEARLYSRGSSRSRLLVVACSPDCLVERAMAYEQRRARLAAIGALVWPEDVEDELAPPPGSRGARAGAT
jgi:hypothetical protein